VLRTQASFFVGPDRPISLNLNVYPLQRVAGHLLLSMDFMLQGNEPGGGLNYFLLPYNSGDGSFRGVSLIDTLRGVRYGVVRKGSLDGGSYSSDLQSSIETPGVWYRVGAFFPAPDPTPRTLDLDLQYGGMLRNIPISGDTTPLPGLVAGSDYTGGAASSAPVPTEATTPGMVVTWPTVPPGPDAFADEHDLVAKVVGGRIGEGAGRTQGSVSVNADVLFAFNSARLSPTGAALVAQTAAVLAAKADPAVPVQVVGHTDSKGTDDYNQKLSLTRAQAVASALSATSSLSSFTFRPSGRGATKPVAANTLPGGADNPTGRALNRRVEALYSPKSAPVPDVRGSGSGAAPGSDRDAETTDALPTGPDVTLPPVRVKGVGVDGTLFSAVVHPLVRAGRFTLVRFELSTPVDGATVLSAFSAFGNVTRDLSACQVIDPSTRNAYAPAADQDNEQRILGTYTFAFNAGQLYHLAFYTAALPIGLTNASVSLGPLGTATNVPVRP
jgi:outer membrane protein OmpA-like peptidoglycan-associated protein